MHEITYSEDYGRWFAKLRDSGAKARIDIRLMRLAAGNPGDVKFVGGGMLELRIDYGPGYRIYYMRRKGVTLLLLAGGDKKSQKRDIRAAIALAEAVRIEDGQS
jgi:putative addiction module killer protein